MTAKAYEIISAWEKNMQIQLIWESARGKMKQDRFCNGKAPCSAKMKHERAKVKKNYCCWLWVGTRREQGQKGAGGCINISRKRLFARSERALHALRYHFYFGSRGKYSHNCVVNWTINSEPVFVVV